MRTNAPITDQSQKCDWRPRCAECPATTREVSGTSAPGDHTVHVTSANDCAANARPATAGAAPCRKELVEHGAVVQGTCRELVTFVSIKGFASRGLLRPALSRPRLSCVDRRSTPDHSRIRADRLTLLAPARARAPGLGTGTGHVPTCAWEPSRVPHPAQPIITQAHTHNAWQL